MSKQLGKMTNEELLQEYKDSKSLEIKQELVMRYLYIIEIIARKMKNIFLSFAQVEDIVNEGVIVLMNALDKYDVSKGIKFETFVQKRLSGMVIDLARKQDWVPRNTRKMVNNIRDYTDEYYMKNGAYPSDKEIAMEMGIEQSDVEKYQAKEGLMTVLSLDLYLQDTAENFSRHYVVASDDGGDPEKSYMEREMRGALLKAIGSLKEREQLILSLYYVEEISMVKIAEILDISVQRVSQINRNAIDTLTKKMNEYLNV